MAKRVLAVAVAIALVALAFIVRRAIDDDDQGAGPGSTTTTTAAAGPPVVVCASELAVVCELGGVVGTVEPAGTTAARLEGEAAAALDAWVTLAPWPTIVDDARARRNLPALFGDQQRLGSSPLALIGPTDRFAALAAGCGPGAADDLTWKCIGERAGAEWSSVGGQAAWGRVKPGHASPVDSAAGLLVFANAVVSYFGRTDFSAIDLSTDPGFLPWVTRLEQSVPTFGDALTTPLDLLLVQPRFDVVGTTQAEITQKAGAQSARFTVTYPAPMAQADAVLATTGTSRTFPVAEMAAALAATGWESPSGDPAAGLPSPGVMVALQGVWREVTR